MSSVCSAKFGNYPQSAAPQASQAAAPQASAAQGASASAGAGDLASLLQGAGAAPTGAPPAGVGSQLNTIG